MTIVRRYECFCIDPTEQRMFAGDISGRISTIDIDSFQPIRHLQAHFGTIHALAVHPALPYLAALSNDRTVSIWRIGKDHELTRVVQASIRDLSCENDDMAIAPLLSHSVALGFHDSKRRLVTRTGNGGAVELEFDDDGTLSQRWALRLHGDWDVQMTRYVVGSDAVLSAGRDASLVLVEEGREVRRWTFGDVVAHWAEHLHGSIYLVASDLGLAARVDIESDDPPQFGERFAHDDMEFLTYNRTSGRAFGTSFDRNVYEVDPRTLRSMGVVYSPGYKCIWAKTLERCPTILLVQSRNGGLYKADLSTGETIAVIKDVPDALWSVVMLPGGDMLGAGEGDYLVHYRFTDVDDRSSQRFETRRIVLPMAADSYAKRIVFDPATRSLAFGRTDGDIWAGTLDAFDLVTNLGSAVRDLAFNESGRGLFAATEDGRIVAVDIDTGAVVTRYQDDARPFARAIWAHAYNRVHDLLAFAPFGTTLHVVRGAGFTPIVTAECARVKRIRWLDATTLLYGSSDEIVRLDVTTGETTTLVMQMQNTIEDFIWDHGRRYLLCISYQCTIGLFDFDTGVPLDHVRDQIDYAKGVAWLDPAGSDAYPMDFVTWGRSGECHLYRIHNERIVAMGPVGVPSVDAESRPDYGDLARIPVASFA